MAKDNNLQDFLTDVANAIREKKGTSELINPQDFSAEIESIQTGEQDNTKDINFYDYDGTLLFAYTFDEAKQLTMLPTPPEKDLLIFDGWTHTLEDIATTKTRLFRLRRRLPLLLYKEWKN